VKNKKPFRIRVLTAADRHGGEFRLFSQGRPAQGRGGISRSKIENSTHGEPTA
jgi:hypothetical protein